MVAQHAGAPPPTPMLLAGIVPPLADAFSPRPETGLALRAGLNPGDTVVLTQAEPTPSAPAGQGGTGKTQLAVAYVHALWNVRAVEVLVWVTAASREAVLAGFAEAAQAVGASRLDGAPAGGQPAGARGADGRRDEAGGRDADGWAAGGWGVTGRDAGGRDAETAAAEFAAWTTRTSRPWALVLDDLADPADLEHVWPAGPAGQVVITTRLTGDGLDALAEAAARNADRGARLAGGPRGLGRGSPQLRIAPVGGFSPRENLAYFGAQLTEHPDQRLGALDLGGDLDGLPLGLAQAAAVMKLTGLGCREYRAQFAERRGHMAGVQVPGVSATVLATWSLAAEYAHRLAPAGTAWPALVLAALLDPHGIPGAVLTSPAACSYITGRAGGPQAADQDMVRGAITNLARAGLVTLDPASPVRTVRLHRSVQAAVRAYLPAADLEAAVLAAADALLQAWPDAETEARPAQGPLAAALRGCAAALRAGHDGPLWQGQAHPLLHRAGLSLQGSGLTEAAIGYWQAMLVTSSQRLGSGHADTVAARERLAAAYESGGRFGDAIAVFAGAVADAERSSGYEHPDTITARGRLAHAYASAGRPGEAAALYEQVIAAAGRQLGAGHPVTLTARAQLAQAYLAAGRGAEATAVRELLLADADAILGRDHPLTRSIRENLDHGPAYL